MAPIPENTASCSYFIVKMVFSSGEAYCNNFLWDSFRGLNVYRYTLFSVIPFTTFNCHTEFIVKATAEIFLH